MENVKNAEQLRADLLQVELNLQQALAVELIRITEISSSEKLKELDAQPFVLLYVKGILLTSNGQIMIETSHEDCGPRPLEECLADGTITFSQGITLLQKLKRIQ